MAYDKTKIFTVEELTWIKAHPTIRLVVNISPPPISFWEGADTPDKQAGSPPEPGFGPPQDGHGPPPGEHFRPMPGQGHRPPPGEHFGPPPGEGYGSPPGEHYGSTMGQGNRPQQGQNAMRPAPLGSNRPLVSVEPNQSHQFVGVAAEYLKEIQKITGIEFLPVFISYNNFRASLEALKNNEADLMPSMITATHPEKSILLTEAYIQIPIVVVMPEKSNGFKNIKQLSSLKLAGVLSIRDKLIKMGLNADMTHTSPLKGLVGVSTGEYDAFICGLSSISHELTKNPVTQIKIAGELPLPSNIAMGVSTRMKAFVPIFNKALKIVSSNQKTAIKDKWFKITYEKKWLIGHWFWIGIGVGGLVLIGGFIGLLHYKRRYNQIQTAVDTLDPHLLSANIDQNILITQVTEALCQVTGFHTKDLVGKPLMALGSPVDGHPDSMDVLWQTIKKGESWKGEVKIQKKDGSTLWTEAIVSPLRRENDNNDGYTVIYQDVSQQKHFENLATKDELTKLYNRRHFNTLAPQLLSRSKQKGKTFALILMDVDNFKKYNDTYGHPEGDIVLAAIGQSLNSIFKRRSDLAFRLGGEEFGVIALVSNPKDAETVTEKARQAIQDLAIIHELNPPGVVTISMGLITLNSEDDADIDTLYKKADKALYSAKEGGRNRYIRSFE